MSAEEKKAQREAANAAKAAKKAEAAKKKIAKEAAEAEGGDPKAGINTNEGKKKEKKQGGG